MLQRILAMVLALSLLVGSSAIVVAQNADATPPAEEEGDDASGAGSSTLDPVIGDPVTFVGENGEDVAVFTVEDAVVPFEDFGEFFDPEADATYIAVQLTVENVDPDDDPFELSTFDIGLQDNQGFYYFPGFVSLNDDSEFEELEDEDLAPGDTTTGYLFYAIPEDNEPVRLFYSPIGRLLQLADLRDV
ncbi:MAG TPA: DUF4352 domain-containing protein [Thermomicrobiales bacterium]|nr:DUF4352 domain-containing protein [Thermomicrobiales bacterium]